MYSTAENRILARSQARKNKKKLQNGDLENTDDTRPISKKSRSDAKALEEENGVNLESQETSPKKKKKKKAKQELETNDENHLPVEIPEDEVLENTEPENTETEKKDEPAGTGFTILEEFRANKNNKVFRVLPTWLAKPSVISCDLSKNKVPISEISGLDRFLIEALKRNKIEHFFPVQQQVIPWLLESQQQLFRPCDMCVSAPTGSGKTLAFVLPTVQALWRHSVRQLRCLAVLPVHDLAVQVYRVYSSFCADTNLQVALISGQASFYEEQQLLVRKSKTGQYLTKPDIVVCTPGRLVDHLQRTPGFSLKSLRYLIIDEADRIMEEEHNDWLFHAEKAIGVSSGHLIAQKLSVPLEKSVQKLLFSATLSQDPEKLTRLGLFQPKLFTSVVSTTDAADNTKQSHHFVGKFTTPAELTEHYFKCPPMLKPLAVYCLLKKFKYRTTICFTNSLAATHRLCELLKQFGDLKVAECSSKISKGPRDKLLKDFSSGKIDLLVCTDAVSRGMDLGVVDCVISYDSPKYVKNYIHRAGRAARAGRPGTAITILVDSEMHGFHKLLGMAEKKNVTPLDMQTDEFEVYEEQFRKALDGLKNTVKEEIQSKIVRNHQARQKKGFKLKSKKGNVVSTKLAKHRGKSVTK
ncbi:hypothetical protein GHT06_016769 [Daphnia sinensis]|uniref:ATP-dependent RNA helicase n=1 Tax=Daphnia sinensis TaxID=1820382 RepID=A0AAD5L6A7_9CRUS|nr:hypothetical protein GHT06_016769 [Daphnia sinensis]